VKFSPGARLVKERVGGHSGKRGRQLCIDSRGFHLALELEANLTEEDANTGGLSGMRSNSRKRLPTSCPREGKAKGYCSYSEREKKFRRIKEMEKGGKNGIKESKTFWLFITRATQLKIAVIQEGTHNRREQEFGSVGENRGH